MLVFCKTFAYVLNGWLNIVKLEKDNFAVTNSHNYKWTY